MKTIHEIIQATHFRYLEEKAIQNPILFIKQFCSLETEIEFFRADVQALVHASATRKTDHGEKFYVNPEDYVYTHRQMTTVIEVLWILHHHAEPNLSIANTHPLYQKSTWKRHGIDVKARINNHAPHYRKLENQEVNNIRTFLTDFFLYQDLNKWRETLDDLLAYAHIDDSILYESRLSYEFVPICEYLEKIVEAIFLIAELIPADHQEIRITEGATPDENLLPSHSASATEQDNDDFTNTLLNYLTTYWSHLEEDEPNFQFGAILFSEALEKELLLYFETFDPTFLSRNFRRVYMGYLEHLFNTGTPYYHEELRIFTAHMDTFFELLDLAAEETAHWPQENRLGREED